jgi:hypothetical protein
VRERNDLSVDTSSSNSACLGGCAPCPALPCLPCPLCVPSYIPHARLLGYFLATTGAIEFVCCLHETEIAIDCPDAGYGMFHASVYGSNLALLTFRPCPTDEI